MTASGSSPVSDAGTWRAVAAAAVLSLLGSAIMLQPFMDLSHIGSALHVGDGRVQAWVLAWVAHALTSGASLFDANMFYPTSASLAHTDHMVALGIVGAPLWLATHNAVLVFNVLQLLGPAYSSFAAFLLFRRWTGDWGASIVGGLLFGLSFFTLLHNAHLNLTWAGGIPLAMLLLERWWERPTWGHVTALWLVVVFTALTSWYLAAVLVLALLAHAAMLVLVRERPDMATAAPQLIAALALGVAAVLPFLAPYLGRGSEAGETAALAADWRSYVVPPEHTVLGRWMVRHQWARPQGIWGERTLFLGWTALMAAAFGLLTALTSGVRIVGARASLLLTLTIGGAWLSFGPSSSGFAAFDLLAHVPGLAGFRSTARFGLLVGFGCAGLCAFALAQARSLAPRWSTIACLLLGVLVMGERFVVDFPAGRPQPEAAPEIYALAQADGARAAIALPIYAGQPNWFFEGDYLLYSTTADFLRLANGIGRWVPPEYMALGEAMRTFPSAESARALRLFGITHALLHSRRLGDGAARIVDEVRRSHDYSVVAERGPDLLLRVSAIERAASSQRADGSE